MQYLIMTPHTEPFIADNFTPENDFNLGMNMVVYDLVNLCYMQDGVNWLPMKINHL